MKVAFKRQPGALPLLPRDLTQLRRNDSRLEQSEAAPVIPATESTLGSHPCVALSSAQVLPEWINRNLAGHTFASNGDYPLNFVSHSRGSLQNLTRPASVAPPDIPALSRRRALEEKLDFRTHRPIRHLVARLYRSHSMLSRSVNSSSMYSAGYWSAGEIRAPGAE